MDHVVVCEREPYSYKDKLRNGIPDKVRLYKGSVYDYLLKDIDSKFHVVNLDLCCHYSVEVYKTLSLLLNNNMLYDYSLLFFTLNPYSVNRVSTPSIADSLEDIKKRLDSQLSQSEYSFTPLTNIPETYKTSSNKTMHSFGWKLERKG